MKIQLAILLVLAGALFACGNTSDGLVGTWESVSMFTPHGAPLTMEILPDGYFIDSDVVKEWWTVDNNFCLKYKQNTSFCRVYLLDSNYLTFAETEEELDSSKDIWKRVSK